MALFAAAVAISLNLVLAADSLDRSQWVLADEGAPTGRYRLPAAAVHPLPPSLASLDNPAIAAAGDYLNRLEVSIAGPLLWVDFPVRIALDFGDRGVEVPPSELERQRRWQQAVHHAIADWSRYLPLQEVDLANPRSPTAAIAPRGTARFTASSLSADPMNAASAIDGIDAAAGVDGTDRVDIVIHYRSPPLRRDPENPGRSLRAAAGRATYRFVLQQPRPGEDLPRLGHRCDIFLAPGRPDPQLLNTARHELGHALGLWGHSDRPSDLMAPNAKATPAPIRDRDLNTLRQVYQQSTRLGWTVRRP